MGNISRRAMLGATGGLIAGGRLKTQADAITVEEEAAGMQTAQADPTKVAGAPTSVLGQRAPGEQPRRDGFPFGESRGIRKTIGNYWPYATTIFDYVNRAMPMTSPGSLTADEVYAVAAYILFLNEIIPGDAIMNGETLPAVVMPARNRFVPDDRVGGPEVR